VKKPNIVVLIEYVKKASNTLGSKIKLLLIRLSKLLEIETRVPIKPKQDEEKPKYLSKSNLLEIVLISRVDKADIFVSIFFIVLFSHKMQVRIIDAIGPRVSSHSVNASFLLLFFNKFIIPSTKPAVSNVILLIYVNLSIKKKIDKRAIDPIIIDTIPRESNILLYIIYLFN